MIASTERGLLLTTLWYIREVDPQTLLLTGLTRDGVYLVENGAVQGAVNNFRFNESPVDLLGRATEVGRTERAMSREWNDFFRRTAMPAAAHPGLQHVDGEQGVLTLTPARSRDCAGARTPLPFGRRRPPCAW